MTCHAPLFPLGMENLFGEEEFSILKHPLMILFDCDQKIENKQKENLYTHTIQQNTKNDLYQKGIENLFPKELFEKISCDSHLKEKYLPSKTIGKGIEAVSKPELQKIKLCNALCKENNPEIEKEFGLSIKEIFSEFKPLLRELNNIFLSEKHMDKG